MKIGGTMDSADEQWFQKIKQWIQWMNHSH